MSKVACAVQVTAGQVSRTGRLQPSPGQRREPRGLGRSLGVRPTALIRTSGAAGESGDVRAPGTGRRSRAPRDFSMDDRIETNDKTPPTRAEASRRAKPVHHAHRPEQATVAGDRLSLGQRPSPDRAEGDRADDQGREQDSPLVAPSAKP